MQKMIARSAFLAGMSLAMTAQAQLPGGTAAQAQQRVQAQVQQRAQQQAQAQIQQRTQQQAPAQVQQRAQAQVQAQVQAQIQQKIQADATRAAQIAQQAAVASQRAASARLSAAAGRAATVQQRASTLNARIGTDVAASNRTRIQAGNNSANASAYARMGLDTRLALPPGLSEADVQVFDNLFGDFNPLRRRVTRENSNDQEASPSSETASTTRVGVSRGLSAEIETEGQSGEAGLLVQGRTRRVRPDDVLDFTTRLRIAARQRRAQISEMRDQALITGDAQLLLRAQRVEESIAAFVDAQTRLQANATGNLAPQTPPASSSGVTNVSGSSNTDTTTTTTAGGTASP